MMYDQTYRQITVDSYFDKIFYINLRKETARNEHMLRQFRQLGVSNYERVEAVGPGELPELKYYRNFIKDDLKYITGSLSCRASHLKCVGLAKARGYNQVLILEDDVVFKEDPGKLLGINMSLFNDWDVLYFGGLVEHFFRNQVVGAFAYALKSSVYDDVLAMAEASGMEIDNFYAKILQHMSYNYNQSGKYNIRLVQPFNMIVADAQFGSSIR